MPKLPSGRTVAIDHAPLCELVLRADSERDASLLMFMENGHEILRYIGVHEAETRAD